MKCKSVVIFIIMLCAVSVWAQSYTTNRLDGFPFATPTTAEITDLPSIGSRQGEIADFSIPKTDLTKYSILFEPIKHQRIVITDKTTVSKICFEIPGDPKRCVDAQWIYLLMVAADIKED